MPTLYLDFEDIRRYRDAVQRVREHGTATRRSSSPRRASRNPAKQGFFKLIERAEPDGVLIRNLGAIALLRAAPACACTGDFSLNVANPLTARLPHRTRPGAPHHHLRSESSSRCSICCAPRRRAWFELTLHQHMPMFHMEHCVFAAFLSKGTDFTRLRPSLRKAPRASARPRRHGASAEGRRRLPQHALQRRAADRRALLRRPPRPPACATSAWNCWRRTPPKAARVIRAYQTLLAGERGGEDLWRELKAQTQLGVTRGTMAEKPTASALAAAAR